MSILYIRPYEGEREYLSEQLPGKRIITAQSVDELSPAELAEVSILSVFVDYQVTSAVLEQLPQLGLIATRSAGSDHIDMAAAADRNIPVVRVPSYGTRTVAEYAVALMFSLSRNAYRAYVDVQRTASVTSFEEYEGFDLCGKTLGVIGTGKIGQAVCRIATGIGMRVVAFDVYHDEQFAAECGVEYLSLEEVLRCAKIVTLHVPSLPQTYHLIGKDQLALMVSGSYLINTARGDVVDTKALVAALRSGHLAGAGLDVLEGEHELREESELLAVNKVDESLWQTLVANHALIDMPNVIVTPHIAFNTKEAKREITDSTISNITAWEAGELPNQVVV